MQRFTATLRQQLVGVAEETATGCGRIPWGHNVAKPIGVAEWETKIVETLPDNLKGSLPTVEEIEAELAEYPEGVPRAPGRKR